MYPCAELLAGILVLAHFHAQGLKLRHAERVGQGLQHILHATFGFGQALVAILEQVLEELHLRPDVVIDKPLHQCSHGGSPLLAVQHPQYATGFPCSYEGSLRHVPQHIVIDKVGQCRHVLSQTVDKVVELADDETPLADVESHKILVHLLRKASS